MRNNVIDISRNSEEFNFTMKQVPPFFIRTGTYIIFLLVLLSIVTTKFIYIYENRNFPVLLMQLPLKKSANNLNDKIKYKYLSNHTISKLSIAIDNLEKKQNNLYNEITRDSLGIIVGQVILPSLIKYNVEGRWPITAEFDSKRYRFGIYNIHTENIFYRGHEMHAVYLLINDGNKYDLLRKILTRKQVKVSYNIIIHTPVFNHIVNRVINR